MHALAFSNCSSTERRANGFQLFTALRSGRRYVLQRSRLQDRLLSEQIAGDLDISHLQRVGQILSSVPKQITSAQVCLWSMYHDGNHMFDGLRPQEYYKVVSSQLLNLIRQGESKTLSQASIYVTVQMINRQPDLAKKFLLNPLVAPLLHFYRSDHPSGQSVQRQVLSIVNYSSILSPTLSFPVIAQALISMGEPYLPTHNLLPNQLPI